ncbi:hypothetical protein BCR36DRAFT_586181 [Piromyces finnis]|uniref:B box-type domain-containing protein n=1 Tax=Piromyces finnis TaxID=1754191 RepID=A0A1Y1V0Z6_9FUNG|nr:hypothetical protein BCR36DRAFT_586181 [Piromyces finnis]|eukprot:ORX44318.1 hypothetical protein BCR36DRAFT_586181 [Piromyces finnis]
MKALNLFRHSLHSKNKKGKENSLHSSGSLSDKIGETDSEIIKDKKEINSNNCAGNNSESSCLQKMESQNKNKFLNDILTKDYQDVVDENLETKFNNNEELIRDAETQKMIEEYYCVECEDQPATLYCEQCLDNYCEVCFKNQHRKGKLRQKHQTKEIKPNEKIIENAVLNENTINQIKSEPNIDLSEINFDVSKSIFSNNDIQEVGEWYVERTKYIPLRLTYEERKYLRLLEATLNVSEYTDKIDIIVYSNRAKRIVNQIKEFCSILSGLVLSANYREGQRLFQNKSFEDNEKFFQDIFEIGRRYKITTPEKMPDYGKLIYLLQDSQIEEIKDMLGFNCCIPLKTVYNFLENRKNGIKLLQDNIIAVATQEILPTNKTRNQIQKEIKIKENAIEHLAKKYANPELSKDDIKRCLYSIGDNHAYLRANKDPCTKMIDYLKKYFKPDKYEPNYSLAIQMGRNTSRLTHNHEKQYNYVLQSLTLWKEIAHEMYKLWTLAEEDLLSGDNIYRLRDTGQGLNRVQNAPRVSRTMQSILYKAQCDIGSWVGSSVIHLGDHNVPNAFMFIDKYTQVSSILNPICICLDHIDELCNDEGISSYIDREFGGLETLKKTILADFFKYAFNGSGADNFFDAGSCIDGRLTSAWHWCSQIEKKSFFPIFLLTGFVGFNGTI